MLVGDSSDHSPTASYSPSPSQVPPATHHRSYIPSLIPPGVDPAKVDSKMFYTYVPNTIKTRKRTTPAQLEILESVFVTDKKPNAPRRKELAKKLKMSPREVQVCIVVDTLVVVVVPPILTLIRSFPFPFLLFPVFFIFLPYTLFPSILNYLTSNHVSRTGVVPKQARQGKKGVC
jgi:hypothetical protein